MYWEVFAHHLLHLLGLLCYQGLLIYCRSGKIRLRLGCPLALLPGQESGVFHRHPAEKGHFVADGVCPGYGSLPSLL